MTGSVRKCGIRHFNIFRVHLRFPNTAGTVYAGRMTNINSIDTKLVINLEINHQINIKLIKLIIKMIISDLMGEQSAPPWCRSLRSAESRSPPTVRGPPLCRACPAPSRSPAADSPLSHPGFPLGCAEVCSRPCRIPKVPVAKIGPRSDQAPAQVLKFAETPSP